MERARMNNGVGEFEAFMAEAEANLRIDPLDLASARAQQPQLFYRVAKALAQQTAERDRVKRMYKEVEAQAIGAVKAAVPAGQKLSVAETDALVVLDPTVRYYGQMVDAANARLAALNALRESYVDRGFAIHDMIELERKLGQPVDPAEAERIKREVAEMRRADREGWNR